MMKYMDKETFLKLEFGPFLTEKQWMFHFSMLLQLRHTLGEKSLFVPPK